MKMMIVMMAMMTMMAMMMIILIVVGARLAQLAIYDFNWVSVLLVHRIENPTIQMS